MFDYNSFLKTLSTQPGVYQMLDVEGNMLYVGKAKNLRARVRSYFGGKYQTRQGSKIKLLVSSIADINVIVTHTETEALLLEQTLIKQYHPRFNVVFRDDKSYPFLKLSDRQKFPSLTAYRGKKRKNARYFGPYPSAYAMQETLQVLQKLFKIRSCKDSFFRNRTRPCLQYQIQRCKAPCVGLVDEHTYQKDIQYVVDFLSGYDQNILNDVIHQMNLAAEKLEFEKAAEYRDLIRHLRRIQAKQSVIAGIGDADIIAMVEEGIYSCIARLSIRQGKLNASQNYFPQLSNSLAQTDEVLSTFIAQFYLNSNNIPKTIFTNLLLPDQLILSDALTQHSVHVVQIKQPKRGDKLRWVQLAITNAREALQQRLMNRANYQQNLAALQEVLQSKQSPKRIECFDVSHLQGEATVASCVVFNEEGALKSDYRRFNITGVQAGDDYAAMEQALRRRYQNMDDNHLSKPDLIIIDGGRGQLKRAIQVLQELALTNISLLSLAKGVARKERLETLLVYLNNKIQEFEISQLYMASSLLQQVRNEAHRFAITGHRGRRKKIRSLSSLEQIEGVGVKRRRALLNYFGGLQGIECASIEELAQVPNISKSLAERIYTALQCKSS